MCPSRAQILPFEKKRPVGDRQRDRSQCPSSRRSCEAGNKPAEKDMELARVDRKQPLVNMANEAAITDDNGEICSD